MAQLIPVTERTEAQLEEAKRTYDNWVQFFHTNYFHKFDYDQIQTMAMPDVIKYLVETMNRKKKMKVRTRNLVEWLKTAGQEEKARDYHGTGLEIQNNLILIQEQLSERRDQVDEIPYDLSSLLSEMPPTEEEAPSSDGSDTMREQLDDELAHLEGRLPAPTENAQVIVPTSSAPVSQVTETQPVYAQVGSRINPVPDQQNSTESRHPFKPMFGGHAFAQTWGPKVRIIPNSHFLPPQDANAINNGGPVITVAEYKKGQDLQSLFDQPVWLFKGDPLEYWSWRNTISSHTNHLEISPMQFMRILRKNTEGEPHELIKTIQISVLPDEESQRLMLEDLTNEMDDRFGNMAIVTHKLKKKIETVLADAKKDYSQLRQFSDIMQIAKIHAKHNPELMGWETSSGQSFIVDLFDNYMYREWCKAATNYGMKTMGRHPNFEELCQWLIRFEKLQNNPNLPRRVQAPKTDKRHDSSDGKSKGTSKGARSMKTGSSGKEEKDGKKSGSSKGAVAKKKWYCALHGKDSSHETDKCFKIKDLDKSVQDILLKREPGKGDEKEDDKKKEE